jgi:hypothetical protein
LIKKEIPVFANKESSDCRGQPYIMQPLKTGYSLNARGGAGSRLRTSPTFTFSTNTLIAAPAAGAGWLTSITNGPFLIRLNVAIDLVLKCNARNRHA